MDTIKEDDGSSTVTIEMNTLEMNTVPTVDTIDVIVTNTVDQKEKEHTDDTDHHNGETQNGQIQNGDIQNGGIGIGDLLNGVTNGQSHQNGQEREDTNRGDRIDSTSSRMVDVEIETADLKSFKKMARCLYQKYIKEGTFLEINIAYDLRQRFVKLDEESYRNATAMDLLTMYDDVLLEMKMFIEQSYMRLMSELYAAER